MISLTLPSLDQAAIRRTFDNIAKTTIGAFEIVVVSPHPEPDWLTKDSDWLANNCDVIWVREKEQRGCNAAHAEAIKHATGEYVVAWVEDHLFINAWDEVVLKQFCAMEDAMELLIDRAILMGLTHVIDPKVGTVFGKYYPYFPMMRRIDADVLGWLSGDYRRGFGDCDLAMRVYANGGLVVPCSTPVVVKHPDDDRKLGDLLEGEARSLQSDMDLFVERWKPMFGKGWNTSHLRDFNVDMKL